MSTQPGSSGFHGDGTFQAAGTRLDARVLRLPQERPQGEYRNFNGYLQGPLRKERVGFLVDAGRWEQDDNANVHVTVLDPATALAQPFFATVSTLATATSEAFQVDFKVFNQTINVSYTLDRRHPPQPGARQPVSIYPGAPTTRCRAPTWDACGGLGRGSDVSFNEVRFELKREVEASIPSIAAPAVLVLDAFNAGGSQFAYSWRSTTVGLQAADTLTVVHGTHTIKTGVQLDSIAQRAMDFGKLQLRRHVHIWS